MQTRLKSYLANFNNYKVKEDSNANQKALDGKYKYLFFQKLPGVEFEQGACKPYTPMSGSDVAIVVPKKITDQKLSAEFNAFVYEREKQKAKHALSLLRKHNIRSPFIHNFFYCGKDGSRISPLAKLGDGVVYFTNKQNDFSDEIIKSLIAQLLLAVSTLHQCNLVHRDIKPDNILIFVDAMGRKHLKLADLDGLVEHDKQDIQIDGTFGFFAPEIFLSHEGYQQQGNPVPINPSQGMYQIANKKILDCYAVGMVIGQISNQASKVQAEQKVEISENLKKLDTLYAKLVKYDPAARATIEQALDDEYFGSTKEEREKYFSKIKDDFSQNDIYLDHYLPDRYPHRNMVFYILPGKIKAVYVLLEKLINQRACASEADAPMQLEEKIADHTAVQLQEAVRIALQDNELQEFHEKLKLLNNDLNEILKISSPEIKGDDKPKLNLVR